MVVQSMLSGTQPGGPERVPANNHFAAHTGPSYSIEQITSEDDLANLREDWNRLSETAESPNVFTTFDWFRAWNQRFTQEAPRRRRLSVLVLKKDGAIVGISPLINRTASRFAVVVRKLEFVGLADYNDFLLGNGPTGQIEAIMDFLVQTQDQWDLVDLRDLPKTGNTLAIVESALSYTGLIYRILPEEDRSPYLLIDAPWSGMVSRLSRSSRHTLRNQQYRLERMRGEGLRVRVIENPQEEPELLEKLIALEGQKRVNGKLVPPFIGRYPEVFQSLFDTLGPRGWIYVALMELGDRPLAWQLGFRCGKRLWDYTKAYDHAFSRFSPGTMLIPAVLDYGFSHGFEEYDFLRGEEPYKMIWNTGYHERFRLAIWSRRWISRARAFVYLDLKTAVYRLFGRSR